VEQGKPFGLSTMSVTSWNPPDVDNEDVIGTVAVRFRPTLLVLLQRLHN
jgi:hypothetical protein